MAEEYFGAPKGKEEVARNAPKGVQKTGGLSGGKVGFTVWSPAGVNFRIILSTLALLQTWLIVRGIVRVLTGALAVFSVCEESGERPVGRVVPACPLANLTVRLPITRSHHPNRLGAGCVQNGGGVGMSPRRLVFASPHVRAPKAESGKRRQRRLQSQCE